MMLSIKFGFAMFAVCAMSLSSGPCAVVCWGDSQNAAPPAMPADFDQNTVSSLIAHVDSPGASSVLKVGYFLNHRKASFPVPQGYDLLVSTAAREPRGSRRWFLMESVAAFAAVRLPGKSQEGLMTYERVFDGGKTVTDPATGAVVWRTLYEFVGAVPGTHINNPSTDKAELSETLTKAVVCALCLPGQPPTDYAPEWKTAFDSAPADDKSDLFDNLGEYLKTHDNLSTAQLKTLTEIYSSLAPDRAAELLRKNQARLTSDPGGDINWFFNNLIENQENAGQLNDALKSALQYFESTGQGRLHLVRLYIHKMNLKKGGASELELLLKALSAPTAAEEDVLATAHLFVTLANSGNALYDPGIYRARATTLLKQYLEQNRERTPHGALDANILLAEIYEDQDENAAALKLLGTIQVDRAGLNPSDQMLFDSVAVMKQDLQRPAATGKNVN